MFLPLPHWLNYSFVVTFATWWSKSFYPLFLSSVEAVLNPSCCHVNFRIAWQVSHKNIFKCIIAECISIGLYMFYLMLFHSSEALHRFNRFIATYVLLFCSKISHRNASDICMFILYPETLLNSVINYNLSA